MAGRLYFLPFLLWTVLAFSATRLQVIHADVNQGRMINGEQRRILSGNVHVLNDTTHIYCDSAIFFEKRNVLELVGNVVLDNGHHRLLAQKVTYYPDLDKAVCEQNVRVSSSKDSLFADALTLWLNTSSGNANGHVLLWDKKRRSKISGDHADFKKMSKHFKCWENARFFKKDSNDNAPLIVTAASIRYLGGEQPKAIAVDSVTISRGTFKSHSDSAVYLSKSEQAVLTGQPQAWIDKSTMQAERILADFDSSKVKHIYLSTNAKAVSLVDSLKKTYNVLQGKIIEFFLTDAKPDSIISRNNASSIYYLDKNGEQQGSNYSTSDSIFVYFKHGKPDSIEIIGGAQGTFYPDGYKGEKK